MNRLCANPHQRKAVWRAPVISGLLVLAAGWTDTAAALEPSVSLENASHLSEQLALKCFVPVVALSDDKSLTSANIPWIFRLPAGTTPASALRLLTAAASSGSANPQTVRNAFASGRILNGISFQPTGEPSDL